MKGINRGDLYRSVIFRSTYIIEGDITDVDLDMLQADGVKGLILDLDSTLIAPRQGKLTPAAHAWLEVARKRFKLAVVTNNKKDSYIEEARSLLNMPVLGPAWKPSRRYFLKALNEFELKPEEVAVIGDRPLTDILGGLRAGMKTILVWPLKSMNEPSWVTFFRKLERWVIKS